jgi:hypothetical protein
LVESAFPRRGDQRSSGGTSGCCASAVEEEPPSGISGTGGFWQPPQPADAITIHITQTLQAWELGKQCARISASAPSSLKRVKLPCISSTVGPRWARARLDTKASSKRPSSHTRPLCLPPFPARASSAPWAFSGVGRSLAPARHTLPQGRPCSCRRAPVRGTAEERRISNPRVHGSYCAGPSSTAER